MPIVSRAIDGFPSFAAADTSARIIMIADAMPQRVGAMTHHPEWLTSWRRRTVRAKQGIIIASSQARGSIVKMTPDVDMAENSVVEFEVMADMRPTPWRMGMSACIATAMMKLNRTVHQYSEREARPRKTA